MQQGRTADRCPSLLKLDSDNGQSTLEADSSVLLKFPTIPVHGTPSTWSSTSQLVSMTSSHDESGYDTTSSLGDSTYDFIDDRSNVTTDDEDQGALTESTTSSDGHAFEQVERHEAEEDEEEAGVDRSHEHQAHADRRQSYSSTVHSQPQDAGSPNFPAPVQYGENESIEFEEPSVMNLNSSRFMEVSHTLKDMEKAGSQLGPSDTSTDTLLGQSKVTVRQTMTSHSLSLEGGQYKVLYIGDQSTKDQIVQKLGTALAANLQSTSLRFEQARSSKFNIVPISSFGEDAPPEVVLVDSSGLELMVEDCSYASFTRKEREHDSLHLKLSDGTRVDSSWTGSRFSISNDWTLPDIAVFSLPSHDSPALGLTLQFARSFMSRHKIPSITISTDSLWDKAAPVSMNLDYLAPHICVEAPKPSVSRSQVLQRFPIDLEMFSSINAGQMNRNLACLAAVRGEALSRTFEKQRKAESVSTKVVRYVKGFSKSLIGDVRKEGLKGLNRYEYIVGFAVMLMSFLGVLVVGAGLAQLLKTPEATLKDPGLPPWGPWADPRIERTYTRHRLPYDVPDYVFNGRRTPSSTVSRSLSSSSAVVASSPSTTTTETPNIKSSSTTTDLASFLLDAYILAPNKSRQFKVHVVGDCHIVLRPPQWLSKIKKTPQLFFKVLRNDIEIEHQFASIFDGILSLKIPKEDAYGTLQVKVWTEHKPIINETFAVDVGSSWLKRPDWKKATRMLSQDVREGIHLAQTGLSIAYDQTKTSLSTFIQYQKQKAAAQKCADKAILDSHLKTIARTKELIVASTRDLQLRFSRQMVTVGSTISKEIQRTTEHTKDLIVYTCKIPIRIRNNARTFGCMNKHKHLKHLANTVKEFRRQSLRENQKRVLKMWWALKGVPNQKSGKTKCKKGKLFG